MCPSGTTFACVHTLQFSFVHAYVQMFLNDIFDKITF